MYSAAVHGKITYEWHADDTRVHTSDTRMTYEYIRVTHEWHTSTYKWHTSTYEWHTDDIRVTYGWHTSTYEWHTDDIRVHTVLGYLPKLKRDLELAFGAHFQHGFFIQLVNTLSIDKVSTSYLFTRYQTKCVIKFLFTQLMTSLTLRFIFNHPLKKWPREGKWGEVRYTKISKFQNIQISRTKRTFYTK